MSIADKLTTIAENEQKVYDKGRTDEWSDFWDIFQQNGQRVNYNNAFYDDEAVTWNDTNFKPKHSIKPTMLSGGFLGLRVTDFAKVFEDRNIEFDTSQCTRMNGAFSHNKRNTRLPIIDLSSATTIDAMCRYSYYLQKIEKIIWSETITATKEAFLDCQRLTEFVSEGTLAKSISFVHSPLTLETIKGLIRCLKDCLTTNQGAYTLTLKDTCKTALEADTETVLFNGQSYTYFNLITAKGWNLA